MGEAEAGDTEAGGADTPEADARAVDAMTGDETSGDVAPVDPGGYNTVHGSEAAFRATRGGARGRIARLLKTMRSVCPDAMPSSLSEGASSASLLDSSVPDCRTRATSSTM